MKLSLQNVKGNMENQSPDQVHDSLQYPSVEKYLKRALSAHLQRLSCCAAEVSLPLTGTRKVLGLADWLDEEHNRYYFYCDEVCGFFSNVCSTILNLVLNLEPALSHGGFDNKIPLRYSCISFSHSFMLLRLPPAVCQTTV